MAWIRRTTERPERRPLDFARFVIGALGVAVVGIWAQSPSSIDTNSFRVVNDLPNGLNGTATAVYALGSIWAALGVVLLLLAFRRWWAAGQLAAAAAIAWGIAELLHDILGPHSIKGLGVHVRTGSGPVFPSTNAAVITALVLVLAPYMVRSLRRMLLVLVVAVPFAALYLGTAFPSDALGGVLLGFGVAGGVLAVFGAPGGRPSLDEIRDAMGELTFDVATVQPAAEQIPHAAVVDVVLSRGDRLRVDAFGRDQRDGQLASRLWRRIMYREPGSPVFGSRMQQVEHIAYLLLLADGAGVHGPRLVKTAVAGPDAAMLVTRLPAGATLSALRPDEVSDAVLASIWEQVGRLHEAGINHGSLDAHHIVVADDGAAAFADFSAAAVGALPYWRDRDVAAALVSTALLVGNDRAVRSAVAALGKDRVGAVIPLVQPAALPSGAADGTKHLGRGLKALRGDLAAATGVEEVEPLKIRRLSWTNIGMLAGLAIALAIAIPSLANINFSSVKSQFSNATWGWVVAAALVYPLIPTAWATALMGCVNEDLPFVPTVLTQLACTFLNLVTPNGIGGTALQIDYLHKEDVPVASAGSAMVLSTGVGGIIQILLLVAAASLVGSQLNFSKNSGGASLGIIALVAAAIGIVLLVPKLRGKVVPAITRAARDIWAVLRNPHKALQLIGGDLAGNLLYPAVLGLCLMAFGHSLGFAQLIVVQLGAGILGNAAPVPGGVGVQEAALTAGLTGFGIASAPALAAVLVFRAITFAIPPIFGFFTLRWLRTHGYA